ncbi:MAG: hypothetical protein ACI31S_01290 [Bacilli bacterium]
MTASTVLPILLYILGAVLLVALIVLTIKVIITMNKIEKVVDNITVKVKTLDGAFEVVEKVTGKFNLITDRIIDIIASFIEKIFKRKEDKNNE